MRSFRLIYEQVTAQRALKRLQWMRKPVETGAIYDKPEHQPKRINLPYQRGKKHAHEAMARVYRNDDWHDGAGTERKYKTKKLSQLVKSPSKLNFTQDATHAHDDAKLKDKSDPKKIKGHIVITTHKDVSGKDQHTVLDGHHALVGAIARGHDPEVKHVHLDHEANELRKTHPQHEIDLDEYRT